VRAIAALAALLVASAALAQHAPPPRIGWIGLYSPALVEWLESPDAKGRTRELVIKLRAAPSKRAAARGEIVVVATPGRGLEAYYRASARAPKKPFVPDLYDSDWGYGPHFHQTFLRRHRGWYQLPADPLPQPAWIDGAALGGDVPVRLLGAEDIISAPQGDLVVLGVEGNLLRARPEQEGDMWCRAGEAPPLEPAEELRIPLRELYGPSGHLRIRLKYLRGC
jgi:hypothetical protein